MDPRRIALNRRHSREMSLLFAQFLEVIQMSSSQLTMPR